MRAHDTATFTVNALKGERQPTLKTRHAPLVRRELSSVYKLQDVDFRCCHLALCDFSRIPQHEACRAVVIKQTIKFRV